MIEVEALPTAVRVTIPRGDVDAATLDSWIGWLRAETILRRSALTEEEADRMAEQAKADWWSENKRRFIAEEAI